MDEDNSNIVTFPREKLRTPSNIQSQEDLLQQIEDYKMSFADDIAEILSNHIFGELGRSGINFEGNIDALFPSMILVTQAIQSLHLKGTGVYHPLQDFAEDAFSEDGDEEESPDEKPVDNSEESEYDKGNDIDNDGE